MLFFGWSGYENRCSAIFQQVPIYRAIRPLIKALFNCWHQMDRWQYGDDLGWQDFLQVDKKSVFQHNASFPLMESCPGPVEMLEALWGKKWGYDASALYIHISRCGISSIFNLSTLKPTASKAAARNTLASYCSQNHLMKHRSTCYLYLFVGDDLTANFCQYTWAFRGVILICSQWPW